MLTIVREAVGTGPVIRDVQPQSLQPRETIDGIQRPSSDVCSQPACRGASNMISGCWQVSRIVVTDVISYSYVIIIIT